MVFENKSKLFGAFSSTLNFNEKNSIWEQIANAISQEHGTIRTKDDVSKKWCNILVKYKPIISDKLAYLKKTGGGPAEPVLTELETKIRSIEGKEIFEGIEAGIDLSMGSNTPLSDLDMAISPAGTLQDFGAQSGSEAEIAMKPPARKRKLNEIPMTDSFKEGILENEKQKVEILKRIDSKLEVIADNVTSSTGLMVGKLELLISNQNKLINLMSTMISAGMQPTNPLPHLPPSTHLPQGYQQQQYFPTLPPFYQQQEKG